MDCQVQHVVGRRIKVDTEGITYESKPTIMDLHLQNLLGLPCDIYLNEKGEHIKGVTLVNYDEECLLVCADVPLDDSFQYFAYTEFTVCRKNIKMISQNIPFNAYKDCVRKVNNMSRFHK